MCECRTNLYASVRKAVRLLSCLAVSWQVVPSLQQHMRRLMMMWRWARSWGSMAAQEVRRGNTEEHK